MQITLSVELAAIAVGLATAANGWLVLSLRALRAEMHEMHANIGRQIAEQKIEIIKGINGTYARSEICKARESQCKERHEHLDVEFIRTRDRMHDLEGGLRRVEGIARGILPPYRDR